nr:MAG TPA: hypothetical protein [Caudoviricetes sp.]
MTDFHFCPWWFDSTARRDFLFIRIRVEFSRATL